MTPPSLPRCLTGVYRHPARQPCTSETALHQRESLTPGGMAGVLRHANPSVGVSSACRSLGWRKSPPVGGGKVAVRGDKAPKSQTTSVKNIENGVCG